MEVVEPSSSNELSSAPSSDVETPVNFSRPESTHSNTITVARNTTTSSTPQNASKIKTTQASSVGPDGVPTRPRKTQTRKKKEVDPNAPPAPEKEKKPRKARAPAGTTTGARANKKQKTDSDASHISLSQHLLSSADLTTSHLVQPAPFVADVRPGTPNEAAKITQNGFSSHPSATNSQPQSPSMLRYQNTSQPQQPAPVPRSRNIFDPVRGIERSSEQTHVSTYSAPDQTPPRQPVYRPSSSPALASILNHSEPQEPLPSHLLPTTRAPASATVEPGVNANGTASAPISLDGASSSDPTAKKAGSEKPDAESKPKRAKEQPPPVPVGSGLLNSTFFGGDSSAEKPEELGKGVNIVLHVDLKDEKNKIFNFARLAEDKYGFAAVYPRQAAQKARLAKVAAAGAALERSASHNKRGEVSVAESGDEDLSVDIDRDSDNDGDINMTGINGTNENSGTDGPVPKQRRRRKDEYDADDPFVDDSEALWEAQAAASKDGFFVYIGALVTDEKPAAERSEGPSKRGGGRGRGRGGGPGSRGGRGGASSTAGDGPSRSGPSTRGNGVTRKPRITKAERQQREAEKEQRKQAGSALATKVTTAPT